MLLLEAKATLIFILTLSKVSAVFLMVLKMAAVAPSITSLYYSVQSRMQEGNSDTERDPSPSVPFQKPQTIFLSLAKNFSVSSNGLDHLEFSP